MTCLDALTIRGLDKPCHYNWAGASWKSAVFWAGPAPTLVTSRHTASIPTPPRADLLAVSTEVTTSLNPIQMRSTLARDIVTSPTSTTPLFNSLFKASHRKSLSSADFTELSPYGFHRGDYLPSNKRGRGCVNTHPFIPSRSA